MKVLEHGTSVLNRKAKTHFVDVDKGTSSASVAKKNADSSREVENVIFRALHWQCLFLFF